jgi:hypothetical protein
VLVVSFSSWLNNIPSTFCFSITCCEYLNCSQFLPIVPKDDIACFQFLVIVCKTAVNISVPPKKEKKSLKLTCLLHNGVSRQGGAPQIPFFFFQEMLGMEPDKHHTPAHVPLNLVGGVTFSLSHHGGYKSLLENILDKVSLIR